MKLILLTSVLTLMLATFSPVYGEIIFQDNFDNYSNSITGWSVGSAVTLDQSGCMNNSKCARVTYTKEGTGPYMLSKDISSYGLSEIYVRFYFKMDNADSGGSKFLKLFGERSTTNNYANSTFMLDYSSNKLKGIYYGNGSGTANDAQQFIRYDGYTTDPSVNIVKSTNIFDPKDGKWHSFEARMKYNNNGLRDGIYQVWIDGELRSHVSNIKNRHDSNKRIFSTVDLANYTKTSGTTWRLWFDEIVISTTPIGTLNQNTQPPILPPSKLMFVPN